MNGPLCIFWPHIKFVLFLTTSKNGSTAIFSLLSQHSNLNFFYRGLVNNEKYGYNSRSDKKLHIKFLGLSIIWLQFLPFSGPLYYDLLTNAVLHTAAHDLNIWSLFFTIGIISVKSLIILNRPLSWILHMGPKGGPIPNCSEIGIKLRFIH